MKRQPSSNILIALILMGLFPHLAGGPALAGGLLDQITAANAAKIEKYIEKAFTKIEEAEKSAHRDRLIARLHVCTLVNKLMMENNGKPKKQRVGYEIKYGTFSKLTSAMTASYSKQRNDQLAAEARTYIKKHLLGSDSARLQIIFNSCVDIHAGKITHALSNMKNQSAAAPAIKPGSTRSAAR